MGSPDTNGWAARGKKPPEPVDPSAPEDIYDMLSKAVSYLVDEVARLRALSSDALACRSAMSGGLLLAELDRRVGEYQARGLRALVRISLDVIKAGGAAADAARKETRDAPVETT